MTLELARPRDMLAEKTVLLRADLDGGVTAELGRTIATLAGRGARVAISSGFGSPRGLSSSTPCYCRRSPSPPRGCFC